MKNSFIRKLKFKNLKTTKKKYSINPQF
jgi:hypothetical protein